MELEQAADQNLAQIADIIPVFETAMKTFDEALKKIEEASEDLKDKWEDTEEKAEAFLKQVADDTKDNDEEATSTKGALNDLKKATLDTSKDLEDELDKGAQEAKDFGESEVKAKEPLFETIMKAVADAAKELEQRANNVEKAVQGMCNDAASFFEGEISSALEENERNMTERNNQLGDWVGNTARPDMKNKQSDFLTKLAEFQSQMEKKMDDTNEQSQTESKSTLESCLGEHMATIQQIMSIGQTLSTVLGGLGEAVKTTGETIGEVKSTVESCVSTSNITMESIMGCFQKFSDIASTFSF